MIAYAAHATAARNRAALKAAGWGLLMSAAYRWQEPEWKPLDCGGLGLALDNGAWSAHAAGRTFDDEAFRRAVGQCGRVDFVVVPDVVMDAQGTREAMAKWLPWVQAHADARRVLIAVQDGMETDDLPLGDGVGVFVGGSTAWKLATMRLWADRAHAAGAWCHVGRVNSARRVRQARAAGVDSIDGSGPSRFADCLRRVDEGMRGEVQGVLQW